MRSCGGLMIGKGKVGWDEGGEESERSSRRWWCQVAAFL